MRPRASIGAPERIRVRSRRSACTRAASSEKSPRRCSSGPTVRPVGSGKSGRIVPHSEMKTSRHRSERREHRRGRTLGACWDLDSRKGVGRPACSVSRIRRSSRLIWACSPWPVARGRRRGAQRSFSRMPSGSSIGRSPVGGVGASAAGGNSAPGFGCEGNTIGFGITTESMPGTSSWRLGIDVS